jgi:hypothetical protein
VANTLKLAESSSRDTHRPCKGDIPLAFIIFWRIRRTEVGCGSDDDDDMIIIDDDRNN